MCSRVKRGDKDGLQTQAKDKSCQSDSLQEMDNVRYGYQISLLAGKNATSVRSS